MTEEIVNQLEAECLERDYNFKCPKCGNEQDFRIQACVWESVTNRYNGESIIDHDGDTEWGDDCAATCDKCEWEGTVAELNSFYATVYGDPFGEEV